MSSATKAAMKTALGFLTFVSGTLLSSCFDPRYVSGFTHCSPAGECPADWSCQAGICVAPSAGAGGHSGRGGGAAGAGGRGGATSGTAGSTTKGGNGGGGGRGGSAPGGGGGGGVAGSSAAGHGGGGGSAIAGSGGSAGTGAGGRGGAAAGTGGSSGGSAGGGRGGSGGAAGIGGAAGATCAKVKPSTAVITDFSTAVPSGDGNFALQSATGFGVGTFTYVDKQNHEDPPTLSVTDNALHVTASSKGSWLGFGLFFSSASCLDASGYTGVSFTLGGTLGTCTFTFDANFPADSAVVGVNDSRATCTDASCYAPSVQVAGTPGVHTVTFASLTGSGNPVMTVDPSQLIGLAWQISGPSGSACSADFTISNLTFSN